jgi:SAM-dependent methyltransferase
VLGFVWPGRTVEITAVDPLADRYDAALARAGLTPPVRTIKGEAERLTEQFPREHFDITFCHNALDHSYDPLGAIQQMLLVTRRAGCVRLEHAVNEGEFEKYTGLHQWNFCAQEGRFAIWSPTTRIDVAQRLGPEVSTSCRTSGRWISVQINRPERPADAPS